MKRQPHWVEGRGGLGAHCRGTAASHTQETGRVSTKVCVTTSLGLSSLSSSDPRDTAERTRDPVIEKQLGLIITTLFFPFQKSHTSVWRGRPGGKGQPGKLAHRLPRLIASLWLRAGAACSASFNCHVARCRALSSRQPIPEVRGFPQTQLPKGRLSVLPLLLLLLLRPPPPASLQSFACGWPVRPSSSQPSSWLWLPEGHEARPALILCSCKIVLPLAAATQGAEAHTTGKGEAPPRGHKEQTQVCDQSHRLCPIPPSPCKTGQRGGTRKEAWGFSLQTLAEASRAPQASQGASQPVLGPPEWVQHPQMPPQRRMEGLSRLPSPSPSKARGYHLRGSGCEQRLPLGGNSLEATGEWREKGTQRQIDLALLLTLCDLRYSIQPL